MREISFIRRKIKEANAKGVVLGLSGGIDSSLVLVLAVKALGKDKVLGLLMPTYFTPPQDIADAKLLADIYGIETKYVDISSIAASFFDSLKSKEEEKIPRANIYSRIRMIILYYYANMMNYLVIGTSDKSEMLLGFFTKYGDGGVDFEAITHLYKTEVRKLGRKLGIPEHIIKKPSSPQLYPNHLAEDELPASYEVIDAIFKRMKNTAHKRNIPEGLE